MGDEQQARPPLRLGTRASPLALAQSALVRDALAAAYPDLPAPEIVPMATTGDAVLDRPLREVGGKGLFTKELDAALVEGRIDIAVHSMKDVETQLPQGVAVDCLLPREDPRDALLVAPGLDANAGIKGLPPGARLGTSSLRRAAQALAARPDLQIMSLRGNVDTRIAKLAAGEADAILLAVAGLSRLGRLGRDPEIQAILPVADMLPAAGQGAIGIARRAQDRRLADLLAPLNDTSTAACVGAERAMLAALDGSCHTPIGALARIDGAQLTLDGLLATPDGASVYRTRAAGATGSPESVGRNAGETLRKAAGDDFFAALGQAGP